MEVFRVEEKVDVPMMNFDHNTGVLEIRGRSFPEDTVEIYRPVLEWVDEYILAAPEKTIMKFSMDYFNSSTYKAVLNLLLKLEILSETGKNVVVEWYYKERDVDMKEAGEEFSELVEIPFRYISR